MSGTTQAQDRTSLSSLWVLSVVALFCLLFGPTLLSLFLQWREDPNYSHGYLVLPISAFLVWEYCSIRVPGEGDTSAGFAALLGGFLVQLLSFILPWWWLPFLSMILVAWGIALAVGGRSWASGLWFPILFLFFMFPLPLLWTGMLSLWLQEQVTAVSAGLLDSWVICQRQGAYLHLPGLDRPLVVAEECSGLRQLITFAALGAYIGYWKAQRLLVCLALVLLAVPITLMVNTIRVVSMGLGAYRYGPGWLDSWLHHTPILFTLPLGFLLFLFAAWMLKPFWKPKEAPKEV